MTRLRLRPLRRLPVTAHLSYKSPRHQHETRLGVENTTMCCVTIALLCCWNTRGSVEYINAAHARLLQERKYSIATRLLHWWGCESGMISFVYLLSLAGGRLVTTCVIVVVLTLQRFPMCMSLPRRGRSMGRSDHCRVSVANKPIMPWRKLWLLYVTPFTPAQII